MSYALGLDFGTSFTAAAVEQDGVVRVATLGNRAGAVPASVFVRPDGSLLHGEEAFMRGASEPLRLVRKLKRRLGDSTSVLIEGAQVESADLVADHLRWAVSRVSEREGGLPDRLVLTHPASWRSEKLKGFLTAVDRADLQPELVTEPHAAAIFHAESHPLAVGDLVAAYDLGGGTFDAAVLRRTRHGFELAGDPEGEDHLGGIDFDDVVLHLVQARLGDRWQHAKREGGRGFDSALAGLRRECVAAKEALSVETEVEIPVMLPGVMAPVLVSRRDFEHLVKPAIEETIGSFRRAIAGAGTTMDGLAAVLLVGGSCRLPIVRESVERTVGSNVVLLDADPKHAVARGAAMLAGELTPGAVVKGDGIHTARPVAPESASIDLTEAEPEVVTTVAVATAGLATAPATGVAPTVFVEGASPPLSPSPLPEPVPAETVVAAPVNGPPSESPPAAMPSVPDDPDQKRRRLIYGGALVALLLVAVPLGLWLTRDSGTEDTPFETSDFTIVEEGAGEQFESTTDTTDGATESGNAEGTDGGESSEPLVVASDFDMEPIAGGTYTLGAEEGPESVAEFSATVEPFLLDLYEVTNQNYLSFVQTVGAPTPLSWERGIVPEDQLDHAVTGVDYVWAEVYCTALGKRLPTETEWEVGARGPGGALYPTGDTPDGLDLDVGASRPVGSTAANVSAAGMFDMVGGVWEWVAEPYVPVEAGQQVRRGGQYGRVRNGSAMRQVVDPAGQATVSETGFRCAATEADSSVQPLVFDASHGRPEVQSEASGPQVSDGSANLLVSDSFDDTRSGFPDVEADGWRIGYHAPSWYHLEASRTSSQVVSLGGYDLADGEVTLDAYVDKSDTTTGEYRYGLVFRSAGAIEQPPPGISGPPRPETYYAFVINPRAGVWQLLHQDELPQRVQASGPLPAVTVTDADAPDSLGVSMQGQTVLFFVNGEQVGSFDTQGFHVGAGNLGLYTETFDESLVHVHFDLLTVEQS